MNYTENLKLKKPEQEEFYDVDDFNHNADILDDELQNIKDNYSLNTHNHDNVYSKLDHNHDDTYVKKTGDSMSGTLSFNYEYVIDKNTDNSRLIIRGGTDNNSGHIALHGKDNEFNGGCAYLIGANDENRTELIVNPNGHATINGQELATENYVSNNYFCARGWLVNGTSIHTLKSGSYRISPNNLPLEHLPNSNNGYSDYGELIIGTSDQYQSICYIDVFGNVSFWSQNHGQWVSYMPVNGGNFIGNVTIKDKNIVRSVNGVNADTDGNVTIQGASCIPDYSSGIQVSISKGASWTAPANGILISTTRQSGIIFMSHTKANDNIYQSTAQNWILYNDGGEHTDNYQTATAIVGKGQTFYQVKYNDIQNSYCCVMFYPFK